MEKGQKDPPLPVKLNSNANLVHVMCIRETFSRTVLHVTSKKTSDLNVQGLCCVIPVSTKLQGQSKTKELDVWRVLNQALHGSQR